MSLSLDRFVFYSVQIMPKVALNVIGMKLLYRSFVVDSSMHEDLPISITHREVLPWERMLPFGVKFCPYLVSVIVYEGFA